MTRGGQGPGRTPSAPACPTCGTVAPFAGATRTEARKHWPHFPFCTDRCRLLDLHKWMTGAYLIPGQPTQAEPPPEDALS